MDNSEQYIENTLMDNSNDLYTEDLKELFDSDDFYAQPKNTKLYIKFNDIDEELIGNAVIANFQETNEKIPIYSYNSPTYNKFLQGKKIVSGVIVLRKITVSNFLSLKKREFNLNDDDKKINIYLDEIKQLEKTNIIPIDIISALNEKIDELNKRKNLYEEKFVRNFNLIDYIDVIYKNKTNFKEKTGCSIKIVFENPLYEDLSTNTIELENVLITRKETEITVEKNDIFEVYNFIGNPV